MLIMYNMQPQDVLRTSYIMRPMLNINFVQNHFNLVILSYLYNPHTAFTAN